MWLRVAHGGCRVVVGTRPAVFAPLRDVGLVYVHREGHAQQREERSPSLPRPRCREDAGRARARGLRPGRVPPVGRDHRVRPRGGPAAGTTVGAGRGRSTRPRGAFAPAPPSAARRATRVPVRTGPRLRGRARLPRVWRGRGVRRLSRHDPRAAGERDRASSAERPGDARRAGRPTSGRSRGRRAGRGVGCRDRLGPGRPPATRRGAATPRRARGAGGRRRPAEGLRPGGPGSRRDPPRGRLARPAGDRVEGARGRRRGSRRPRGPIREVA